MVRISVCWRKMNRFLIYFRGQQTGFPDVVDGTREGFDLKSWAQVFFPCVSDSSQPSWYTRVRWRLLTIPLGPQVLNSMSQDN